MTKCRNPIAMQTSAARPNKTDMSTFIASYLRLQETSTTKIASMKAPTPISSHIHQEKSEKWRPSISPSPGHSQLAYLNLDIGTFLPQFHRGRIKLVF